jgi:hypothetical protein
VAVRTLAPIGEPVIIEAVDLHPGWRFVDHGDGSASLTITRESAPNGTAIYRLAASSGVYRDTIELTVTSRGPIDQVRVGPNPFHDSLFIYISPEIPGTYKIEIFSLSGEIVFRTQGTTSPFLWPGVNDSGEPVASGAYIIRISADAVEERMKVFKL